MSFYIKSFRVSPRALNLNDAVPDGTSFSFETEIVCRKNSNHDTYFFTYSVNDKIIAERSVNCTQADEDNVISDSVNVVSDNWGNGVQLNVALTVSVIQESSGAQLDSVSSTWVAA